jgi:hypothetical protein
LVELFQRSSGAAKQFWVIFETAKSTVAVRA